MAVPLTRGLSLRAESALWRLVTPELHPPRAFPDRASRHEPPVRCRVDPGRSQMKLPLLPGLCPATVTVAVAIHATHSCVSRRPDCTPLHSHSYPHRETRPHAPAWRPTSPVCTATSHTLSLYHTVAHSLSVPHTPCLIIHKNGMIR